MALGYQPDRAPGRSTADAGGLVSEAGNGFARVRRIV
jgi:hypothetical protein